MPVYRRVIPIIKFADAHLYTWEKGSTATVQYLAWEHNTMSPARTRTWTARSGDERINHEVREGVLPCMGYIGMRGPKGGSFSAVLVINRARPLGSGPHTPTHFFFWEYPRGHEANAPPTENTWIPELTLPIAQRYTEITTDRRTTPGRRESWLKELYKITS